MNMNLKPDHILILVASMVGLVLISKARPASAKRPIAPNRSPENLYGGLQNFDYGAWEKNTRSLISRGFGDMSLMLSGSGYGSYTLL